MNIDYSQFYRGTTNIPSYGNGTYKKDTLVKYEFNTTDEHGNKVMDKMSREETLQAMKDIGSQGFFPWHLVHNLIAMFICSVKFILYKGVFLICTVPIWRNIRCSSVKLTVINIHNIHTPLLYFFLGICEIPKVS